jgi:hypothetical protein
LQKELVEALHKLDSVKQELGRVISSSSRCEETPSATTLHASPAPPPTPTAGTRVRRAADVYTFVWRAVNV